MQQKVFIVMHHDSPSWYPGFLIVNLSHLFVSVSLHLLCSSQLCSPAYSLLLTCHDSPKEKLLNGNVWQGGRSALASISLSQTTEQLSVLLLGFLFAAFGRKSRLIRGGTISNNHGWVCFANKPIKCLNLVIVFCC